MTSIILFKAPKILNWSGMEFSTKYWRGIGKQNQLFTWKFRNFLKYMHLSKSVKHSETKWDGIKCPGDSTKNANNFFTEKKKIWYYRWQGWLNQCQIITHWLPIKKQLGATIDKSIHYEILPLQSSGSIAAHTLCMENPTGTELSKYFLAMT